MINNIINVCILYIIYFILKDGSSSLHIATSKGYTKAASILPSNRADVDAQNLVCVISHF